MRRGIVFMLDSFIALVMISYIAILFDISFFVSDIYRDYNLYAYSNDLLTVLDKGGYLHRLAGNDVISIMHILQYSPEQYCFYLRIEDSQGKRVSAVHKPACKAPLRNIEVYSRRAFVYNGEPYMAELGGWYRQRGEE
ncbi:MAG: hypothetical protein QXU54_01485 [Candidatus Micrarchaeia archaeon]